MKSKDNDSLSCVPHVSRFTFYVPPSLRAALGLPALFLLLSVGFLWQPMLTGKVFLPTDLSYRYDYLWKTDENTLGFAVAQNPVLSDVAYYFYPYVNYAIERLRSGHFPLW